MLSRFADSLMSRSLLYFNMAAPRLSLEFSELSLTKFSSLIPSPGPAVPGKLSVSFFYMRLGLV